MAGDDGWPAVLAVGENCEQVADSDGVDVYGEEIVDDEQVGVGESVEQVLVGDAVTAGDDQLPSEVIHACINDFVLPLAGS